IAFLEKLRVTPVLLTDTAGAEAAITALAGAPVVGFDIETGPPGARPAPVRINTTGTLAVRQPIASKAGLDPHTAIIQSAQLYAGGDCCYVFRGDALGELFDSAWFRRQQRFAVHNAGFEAKFIRKSGVPLPQL